MEKSVISKIMDPIQKESQINKYWFLADKWFRIIEFSLIIGILRYFFIKTNLISVKIVYYISLTFFFWFFLELGESVAIKFSINVKANKWRWLVWFISMFITICFYTLITSVAEWVSFQQMG